MNLMDTKVGDRIRVKFAGVCVEATVLHEGLGIGGPRPILIGWKEGEQPGFAWEISTSSSAPLVYLPGFRYGYWAAGDSETTILVDDPPLSLDCPCGIRRSECEYHK